MSSALWSAFTTPTWPGRKRTSRSSGRSLNASADCVTIAVSIGRGCSGDADGVLAGSTATTGRAVGTEDLGDCQGAVAQPPSRITRVANVEIADFREPRIVGLLLMLVVAAPRRAIGAQGSTGDASRKRRDVADLRTVRVTGGHAARAAVSRTGEIRSGLGDGGEVVDDGQAGFRQLLALG